jgi:hypothetical protein
MSDTSQKPGIDRRRFLLGAGVGVTAAAAAQFAAGDAKAVDPGPDETKARYRLSEEVKTFYRVNGYERRK